MSDTEETLQERVLDLWTEGSLAPYPLFELEGRIVESCPAGEGRCLIDAGETVTAEIATLVSSKVNNSNVLLTIVEPFDEG